MRDRVVQTALRAALEPIFEREFADHSYGFRPQRSAKMALQRVDSLLRQASLWVVDVDLKSYFDTVPHAPLMALVKRRIADGRALDLIEAFLNSRFRRKIDGGFRRSVRRKARWSAPCCPTCISTAWTITWPSSASR